MKAEQEALKVNKVNGDTCGTMPGRTRVCEMDRQREETTADESKW